MVMHDCIHKFGVFWLGNAQTRLGAHSEKEKSFDFY